MNPARLHSASRSTLSATSLRVRLAAGRSPASGSSAQMRWRRRMPGVGLTRTRSCLLGACRRESTLRYRHQLRHMGRVKLLNTVYRTMAGGLGGRASRTYLVSTLNRRKDRTRDWGYAQRITPPYPNLLHLYPRFNPIAMVSVVSSTRHHGHRARPTLKIHDPSDQIRSGSICPSQRGPRLRHRHRYLLQDRPGASGAHYPEC